MKPISGNRVYIFPSDRDPKKPCNSQTANMALKRMGFAGRLVSHGLRSLASTTLNEQGFEADLIEAALAHVDDNQVRSAYNRTDYLERRRPMMYWWSGHIEEASQGKLSVTGTLAAYKSTTLIEYEKQSFTSHFINNCNLSHLKQKLSTYDGHGDCLLQD